MDEADGRVIDPTESYAFAVGDRAEYFPALTCTAEALRQFARRLRRPDWNLASAPISAPCARSLDAAKAAAEGAIRARGDLPIPESLVQIIADQVAGRLGSAREFSAE